MAMAIVQMFWGALLIGINMWFTCRSGLRPWTGWADVHSNFSRVALFPTLLIPLSVLRWTYFLWWTIPISSVIFFAFFAFGQDAVKEYVACFRWVRSNILRQKQDGAVFKGIKPHSRCVSRLFALICQRLREILYSGWLPLLSKFPSSLLTLRHILNTKTTNRFTTRLP